MENKYDQVKKLLAKYSQEQLLSQYEKMIESDKEKLLNQILSIDFELMEELFNQTKETIDLKNDFIEPISYVEKDKLDQEEYKRYEMTGSKEIKEGKLAAVTMAGGQGTRLRTSWPKRNI